jgi:hypothetical protein
MSRRTKEFLLRKAFEPDIAIDIDAILCPQSWCVHLLGGHCAPHWSIQLPRVPDAIPLPGAQETCRLVAAPRIAVWRRPIPTHPEGNLGFPLVYHQVEMMRE